MGEPKLRDNGGGDGGGGCAPVNASDVLYTRVPTFVWVNRHADERNGLRERSSVLSPFEIVGHLLIFS